MLRIIIAAALLLLLSTGILGCTRNNMRAEPFEYIKWEGWRET